MQFVLDNTEVLIARQNGDCPWTPQCRQKRGYDTDVKVLPNLNDPETSRTVSVRCTLHHRAVQSSFRTKGLTGKQIRDKQARQFDRCFEALEVICMELEGNEPEGE